MPSLAQIREAFASATGCQIVSAEEFLLLMTSHAAFSRCDQPDANLLGLINDRTGARMLVKAEDLERVRCTAVQLN